MALSRTTDRDIQVMIVEDSATARILLRRMIESEPGMTVLDVACDPFQAVEKMHVRKPDVMLLDIEMPRMDGLTFLRRIMSQNPIPVVICSNHTPKGSAASMKALESGAVEVLCKSVLSPTSGDDGRLLVCDAVRAAAHARVRPAGTTGERVTFRSMGAPQAIDKSYGPDSILSARSPAAAPVVRTIPVVAIGSSTGGTVALAQVLSALPADCPPIAIVQHMPEKFTAAFASRLNGICNMNVREAQTGDKLERGTVLIAPGGHHMVVERNARSFQVRIIDGHRVNRHRPSVDVLFRSVSIAAGQNALGIIMTGMGNDGAMCMLELKQAGAETIAQDEASCVVYGMPKAAVDIGAADRSVPLGKIASCINSFGLQDAQMIKK